MSLCITGESWGGPPPPALADLPTHSYGLEQEWHAAPHEHQHHLSARGDAPDLQPHQTREEQPPEYHCAHTNQAHDDVVGEPQAEVVDIF